MPQAALAAPSRPAAVSTTLSAVGKEVSYTPRQVTMALQQLARNQGDVGKTANELINDEFMVARATLVEWVTETHSEQYQRIADGLGAEIERGVIRQAQDNLLRAGQIEATLLERVEKIERPELVPNALRAVTNVRAKATHSLLLLTGRSVTGNDGGATIEAMTRLVVSLQSAGLVKVAPNIAATLGPEEVQEVQDGE